MLRIPNKMSHIKAFKQIFNDGIRSMIRPRSHTQLIDVFVELSELFHEHNCINVHTDIGDQSTEYDIVIIYTDNYDTLYMLSTYIHDVTTIVLKGHAEFLPCRDDCSQVKLTYNDEHIIVVLCDTL
jgi:mRNA-degrading endonuclease YafQ of YafQ-DinJ toxin-antitoxin module